jgi:hypothetical protein
MPNAVAARLCLILYAQKTSEIKRQIANWRMRVFQFGDIPLQSCPRGRDAADRLLILTSAESEIRDSSLPFRGLLVFTWPRAWAIFFSTPKGRHSLWQSILGIAVRLNGLRWRVSPFAWQSILPRSAAGNHEDDNHCDERRAEQQQLVENAGCAMVQRRKDG